MRINLTGEDKSQRRRRKGKRRGDRRSRTFESAIALPQASSRGSGRGARPRRKSRRSRTATRQQTTQPEVVAPSPVSPGIRWRTVLARMPMILILAALIGSIAYASADAKFFVYDARIMGASHLETETIYQAAGVHEQNIFWIQPQKATRRILQLEGIKAVRVHCSLPAQVTIEVEEREPVVMWRVQSQERDWWLDEEGIVLPYHGNVHSPNTIFVLDSSERHLKVGDRIEPEGIVRSVQQLAAALPEIKVFLYQEDRGLSFTQRVDGGGWPVYVGNSEDLPHKIQVVQALTDYLMTHNVHPRYVDVRWANHPVYGRPESE